MMEEYPKETTKKLPEPRKDVNDNYKSTINAVQLDLFEKVDDAAEASVVHNDSHRNPPRR